jgi:hypothetical protein
MGPAADLPLCRSCGRPITPRRGHRPGQEVVYCSAACRRTRVGPRERALEEEVLRQLKERGPHATLCPSEVARRLEPEDWRPLTEPVRRAARRLAGRGALTFEQGGRRVDPGTARGPVRLRLARPPEASAP